MWKQTWPIFILPINWSLTRATFREALNAIFQNLKMHPYNFNTHSFIIGAAISAKQAGISNSHIKPWASGEAMPTLNTYVCHLKTYLSHPSILLHHPPHAVNLPYLPTITVLSFQSTVIIIHCCTPVCMYDIFIVVFQYACVIMYIASYV